MRTFITIVVIAASLVAHRAAAGVGSIIVRDGVEYVTGKIGRTAVRDAAEVATERIAQQGAEKALGKVASKALVETAEQVTKTAGVAATRATQSAASAVLRYGESASGLINQFGDDAAEALIKVSTRNGRRLVMIEQELAQSGQAVPLLNVVKRHGDAAVEWLWANKATVAIGVGATVLLTNPDAVLNAGASVATAAIDTVGSSVVKPVSEGIVWLVSRLALLLAVAAVGSYALWLKVPALRDTISQHAHNVVNRVRTRRK